MIFFHELGHFETARIFHFEVDKIYLYPTGGVSKYTTDLNVSWIKEFLVLLNGPLIQIVVYLLFLKLYPYKRNLEFLTAINHNLLLFNLLPIYPLDGGKLLNIILNLFFSYKKSFEITIKISYFIVGIFLFFLPLYFKINYIFIIIFLLIKITEEKKKEIYYFDKFLLERYLNNYSFKNIHIVKSVNEIKKGYSHIIVNPDAVIFENDALKNKFENK